MKKLLLALFLLPLFAISQNKAITTQDEYNYLTKGYKIQVESGLDMKKGYSLEAGSKQKIDAYNFDFFYFKKDNNKIVSILVIAKSNVSGSTYYYAIPFFNSDLMTQYYTSISAMDERMTTAYAIAVSQFLTQDVNKWN